MGSCQTQPGATASALPEPDAGEGIGDARSHEDHTECHEAERPSGSNGPPPRERESEGVIGSSPCRCRCQMVMPVPMPNPTPSAT